MYLAPEPVRTLEDWFLSQLRPAFPPSVYVLISHLETEDQEPVPYDFARIIYTGLSTNVLKDYSDQYFNFKVIYSSHTPATLLPHRRTLSMLERGRKALWEKLPPVPAQAFPLLLKSEKLAKASDCNCGPTYIQEWQAYNRLTNILVPNPDPCTGAGEPGAVIPNPNDYVTPFPPSPDTDYIAPNPDFNPDLPIENGTNQPYNYFDGNWVINPNYNPDLPTTGGNLPFVIKKFLKPVELSVFNNKNQRLWPGTGL